MCIAGSGSPVAGRIFCYELPATDDRLFFYRRLVNQHDGDIVLDGIHTVALIALECGAVFHQFDRSLTVGARENFEEFGIDRHGASAGVQADLGTITSAKIA
jgi:hypothetical protein